MSIDNLLKTVAAEQPFPLTFMTISGAHLYGFPSADSDYDLRGAHIAPLSQILSLDGVRESVESTQVRDGVELDLVTYEVANYFHLLLKKNGNLLEQIYSPLVIYSTSEFEALKRMAKNCVTRYFAFHYFGFSKAQWGQFNAEYPHRVKPLLYTYRILLTGIHLMRTGETEANLVYLNEMYKLPYINDLIARKTGGVEQSTLDDADIDFHRSEYERLRAELEIAQAETSLPEHPPAKDELSNLLIQIRYSQFDKER